LQSVAENIQQVVTPYSNSNPHYFKGGSEAEGTVLKNKRKRLLALIGTVITTVLLCLIVPQSVIAVYFLIIFIAIIYAFVKIIQTMTSPSEREKFKHEIWGEQ